MLAKVTEKFEQFIRLENGNSDSTDNSFDLLRNLVESVHEDFEELIDVDSNSKKFIKAFSRYLHCY